MLHPSIESRFRTQRRQYGRALRILFGLTGVYWIFIYVVPGLTALDIARLRINQTPVYFVLLTIWGLDYLREERRLGAIVKAANRLSVAPHEVTMQEPELKPTLFTMVIPPTGTSWSIWNLVFAIGMTAGAVLIVFQYIRLFTAIAD